MTKAYRQRLEDEAAIRIGLLSNPMAATNWRSVAHRRLMRLLPDPNLAISTPSVSHVDHALSRLLFESGCNVLAINGGDGTIHVTLQALIRLSQQHGLLDRLPTLLFLNGGGMNMLARTFDTRGHPVRTLSRFVRWSEHRVYGEITRRSVPILKIEEESESVRYGVIFGSELVLNALTMYERFGRGYRGLSRLLGEVAIGSMIETENWRTFHHLLEPPNHGLVFENEAPIPYMCAVASTVPMTLALGTIRTLTRHARPGSFEAMIIEPRDIAALLRLIPGLMMERSQSGVLMRSDVKAMSFRGPYTLDGERFTHLGSAEEVWVRGSEIVLDGVWMR